MNRLPGSCANDSIVTAVLPRNVSAALHAQHATFVLACTYVLSVVAPYYNQPEDLWDVITTKWAPYSARARATVELVVVDDGSMKEPIERHPELQQRCVDVGVHCTFVTIEKDIGFNHPGALNTGVALAKGRYVAFLDLDHWLLPYDMDALLDELDEHGPEPYQVVEYLPTRHTNLTDPKVEWKPHEDLWYKTYFQGEGTGGCRR